MKRLLLFDIDGTLLDTRGAARRAFHQALLEVYGRAGPIGTHPFDGKTDPQIARELLSADGLPDAAIDAGLPSLWDSYLRLLETEISLPEHRTLVYPGVLELLRSLRQSEAGALVGLLTGNVERGAALKLKSAGLDARWFRVGAYGSDGERRDALPAIAVDRASALVGRRFSGGEIVVIGDTPADVTCGRALGVRAIGVSTGRHDARTLAAAGAHSVLPDLADTAAVLEILLGD